MIVAFTLTPMMAARILPPPPPEGEHRRQSWLERGSDFVYRPIAARCTPAVLAFCLRHRWVVGLAIVGSCATTVPMCKKVGGDFLPPNDEAQFEIYVQTPEGTTLEATTLVRRAARAPHARDSRGRLDARHRRRQRSAPGQRRQRLRPHDRPRDARAQPGRRSWRRSASRSSPTCRAGRASPSSRSTTSRSAARTPSCRTSSPVPTSTSSSTIGKTILDEDAQGAGRRRPRLEPRRSGRRDHASSPTSTRAAMLGVDPQDITMTLAVLVGGVAGVDVRGPRRPVPGVPARRRAVPQRPERARADRCAVAHARHGAARRRHHSRAAAKRRRRSRARAASAPSRSR